MTGHAAHAAHRDRGVSAVELFARGARRAAGVRGRAPAGRRPALRRRAVPVRDLDRPGRRPATGPARCPTGWSPRAATASAWASRSASRQGAFEARLAEICAGHPWLAEHPVRLDLDRRRLRQRPAARPAHPLLPAVRAGRRATPAAARRRSRPSPAGSDLRQYVAAGVPTLHYGPGDLHLAHGPRRGCRSPRWSRPPAPSRCWPCAPAASDDASWSASRPGPRWPATPPRHGPSGPPSSAPGASRTAGTTTSRTWPPSSGSSARWPGRRRSRRRPAGRLVPRRRLRPGAHRQRAGQRRPGPRRAARPGPGRAGRRGRAAGAADRRARPRSRTTPTAPSSATPTSPSSPVRRTPTRPTPRRSARSTATCPTTSSPPGGSPSSSTCWPCPRSTGRRRPPGSGPTAPRPT